MCAKSHIVGAPNISGGIHGHSVIVDASEKGLVVGEWDGIRVHLIPLEFNPHVTKLVFP